jgi:hypothetical protein
MMMSLADTTNTSSVWVGPIIAGISGIIAAVLGYLGITKSRVRTNTRSRTPSAPPVPPLTPTETAAAKNYSDLQAIIVNDRKNFAEWRTAQEASDRDFRAQVAQERAQMQAELRELRASNDYAFNWMQMVEEDLVGLQQFTVNVMASSTPNNPPYPPMPVRRNRPPRPGTVTA